MKALRVLWLVLALVASSACSERDQPAAEEDQEYEVRPNVFPEYAATLLRSADTLEVLSLRPVPASKDDPKAFHEWPVLGTVLVEGADREALVETVIKSVAPPDTAVALCFDPRHGIHAITENGTVDLVICFECNQVRVYYSAGGEESYIPDFGLYTAS